MREAEWNGKTQKMYSFICQSEILRYFCTQKVKATSMMRRFLAVMMAAAAWMGIAAQTADSTRLSRPFNSLDVSLTAGTTGLGFDVSTNVSDWMQLRAGFAAMPHFDYTMHFGVQVGSDPATSSSKFERLSGILEGFTGSKVDDTIDMVGTPKLWNAKLLCDLFPFRDKRWHITAGVYLGPSVIARAENALYDAQSLNAVSIYNNMYDKAEAWEPLFDNGDVSVYLPSQLEDKILEYGRMAMHVGDYAHDVFDDQGNQLHAKGDPYLMEPNTLSMVTCRIKTSSIKPYLGFGYGGRLFKGTDRYSISFDAGVMMWGGTPQIITHDGTDLAHDVDHIGGKVGSYVDFFSAFKVFPVLNIRLTRKIF